MQSTIHMGWNSCVAFDKAVDPFVSNLNLLRIIRSMKNSSVEEWASTK